MILAAGGALPFEIFRKPIAAWLRPGGDRYNVLTALTRGLAGKLMTAGQATALFDFPYRGSDWCIMTRQLSLRLRLGQPFEGAGHVPGLPSELLPLHA